MRFAFCLLFFAFLALQQSKADFAQDNTLNTDFFKANYLDASCYTTDSNGGNEDIRGYSAKSAHPMTARIVECIEGTIRSLFVVESNETHATLFQTFQYSVRPLMMLIMVLYVAIQGYAMILGKGAAEKPKKEMVMFVVKFAMVYYFAMGDAWKDFFFDALRSISHTAAQILIEAGASTTADGCIFSDYFYPEGKDHIALFDTIDCKFGNYMGWFRGEPMPKLASIGFSYLIFPPGLGVMVFIVSIVFIVQLIILASRITQLYLVSIILLSVLLYASPFIIPLVLFESTDQIYKKWLDKVLALAIHPIIVFALAGIVLSITDRIFYGDDPGGNGVFVQEPVTAKADWSAGVQSVFPNGGIVDCGAKSDACSESENVIRAAIVSLARGDPQFLTHTWDGDTTYVDRVYDTVHDNPAVISDASKFQVETSFGDGIFNQQQAAGLIAERTKGAIYGMIRAIGTKVTVELTRKYDGGGVFGNAAAKGAFVDSGCHGGVWAYKHQFTKWPWQIGLVCILGWFGPYDSIMLPIPGWIEIVRIYLPWRDDLAAYLMLTLIVFILMNIMIGEIFEQLEAMIDKISGVSIRGAAGGSMNMLTTTLATGKSAHQHAKDFKDRMSLSKGKETDDSKKDEEMNVRRDEGQKDVKDDPGKQSSQSENMNVS